MDPAGNKTNKNPFTEVTFQWKRHTIKISKSCSMGMLEDGRSRGRVEEEDREDWGGRSHCRESAH